MRTIEPKGALTDIDAEVIRSGLVLAANNASDTVRVLEVGTFDGFTAKGIKNFIESIGKKIQYWGVDSGRQSTLEPPFEEAIMIKGDSAEVFYLVPGPLDFVFIDGCHCGNHVILDTIHYGALVRKYGVMAFHDTGATCQGMMRDSHGPDIPWFYNAVVEAHKKMGFPGADWQLMYDGFDETREIGGTRAYQRI